jgi:hypothetical protein
MEIIQDEPLMAKLAAVLREVSDQVRTETGYVPAFIKVGVQMPDDSVFEARVEICPDGCGQVMVTPAVLGRL